VDLPSPTLRVPALPGSWPRSFSALCAVRRRAAPQGQDDRERSSGAGPKRSGLKPPDLSGIDAPRSMSQGGSAAHKAARVGHLAAGRGPHGRPPFACRCVSAWSPKKTSRRSATGWARWLAKTCASAAWPMGVRARRRALGAGPVAGWRVMLHWAAAHPSPVSPTSRANTPRRR
jgi:hypothetical protein